MSSTKPCIDYKASNRVLKIKSKGHIALKQGINFCRSQFRREYLAYIFFSPRNEKCEKFKINLDNINNIIFSDIAFQAEVGVVYFIFFQDSFNSFVS